MRNTRPNRNSSHGRRARKAVVFVFFLVAALLPVGAWAVSPGDNPATYTLNADFALGTTVNVNYTDVADQLQLDSVATPFNFIWVSVSSAGTVVKIDTQTGAVLGEYRTAPQGMGLNPSRTTVDNNGNVWVANRNEFGLVSQDAIAPGIPPVTQQMGSIVRIGLQENGQCVDRNGNGLIDTSTGLVDVKAWSNAGGVDTLGGVATADDECIINYTRVTSTGTRHLSVNANNDVWVGGTGIRNFDLVDGATGAIVRHETSVGYGGYGGLIDGNGVIWSARSLLRWNTAHALSGSSLPPPWLPAPAPPNQWTGYSHDSYGLCIDSLGNVWNTALFGNAIRKFAPDGTLLGTFSHGSNSAQGCVVDANDDVWVAHSLLGPSSTVGHILNDGTYIGNVTVGSGPTGVAVDAAGKIWATNYYGRTASRIDPAAGPIGADGVTPIGAVDFTTVDLGGELYNYSDMTGSTLIAPPNTGTWTVIHDSGVVDAPWSEVSWTSSEPGDSSITVTVASSDDGISFGADETMANGGDPTVDDGQYLRVTVTFQRASTSETPVLYDLTLLHNRPPVADPNGPYLFPLEAGPFDGSGSSDPDGDALSFMWDFGDSNTGTGETPSHTYAEAGIYDVCLTVSDGLADSEVVCTTAIIYDPSAGFVTGGGWIDSPPYAYHPATDTYYDGSFYELVYTGETWLYWEEARLAAEARSVDACTSAHLATVTSEAEQEVIAGLMEPLDLNAWIGGFQPPTEMSLADGWQWVTGEDWTYANWAEGEPNDNPWGTHQDGTEQHLEVYQGSGLWNDAPGDTSLPLGGEGKHFYIVEYEGCDPGPTGKANFGFVSKYKKGATVPTGNTEFQFHAADLNFHSSSYDWLVVTGSDYARFKGVGTINGEGTYKFMLWAGDKDPDTFRIKIWEEDEFGDETVVYDNGMDQEISGGSIIVHTKKK